MIKLGLKMIVTNPSARIVKEMKKTINKKTNNSKTNGFIFLNGIKKKPPFILHILHSIIEIHLTE